MASSFSPDPALRPNVLQFRITLVGISPPLWRMIQVPKTYVFFGLHSAIQDAVEWSCHCPYRFEKFSRRPEIAYIGLPLNGSVPSYEHDFLISDYFVNEGDTATYFSLHGDNQWKFEVVFEKTVPSVQGFIYPKCFDGKRGCPPRPLGFQAFRFHLKVAADPNHALHEDSSDFLRVMGYVEQFNRFNVGFKDPKERFRMNCGPFE